MLKLNVGFNRKTGEANYGSRGACVNVELDSTAASSVIPTGSRNGFGSCSDSPKRRSTRNWLHNRQTGSQTNGSNSAGNGKSSVHGVFTTADN